MPTLPLLTRDLRALNAGLFICPGFGRHGTRIIDSYELIFVRQGRLSMFEQDTPLTIHAGQTLLLWPRRQHGGAADYPPDLEFYWIHFQLPDAAKPAAKKQHDILHVPQIGTPSRTERLTELFHQFLNDQEEDSTPRLQLDLLVLLMLCETARTFAPADRTESTTLAVRAETFVAAHFHEDIHAGLIAETLECNPDYLGRIFQKHFNQTLTQAIQSQRVQFAKKLLRQSSLSIEQIVTRCGFADPAYFRRIFRRQTGVTPGAFRKLHSRMHINML